MTKKRFKIIDNVKNYLRVDDKTKQFFYLNEKEVVDNLNQLTEENEQLKAQLRKGEDVCSICKYQYLTKRDTDEYYIAKCKKEHIECSRGTVNYCEDFEYKELSE